MTSPVYFLLFSCTTMRDDQRRFDARMSARAGMGRLGHFSDVLQKLECHNIHPEGEFEQTAVIDY